MRTLLVHQAEGVVDHGVSIAVSCNPTPSTPLGPTARVAPACGGESASGAEALWGRESKGGDRRVGRGGNRLDTEVGYGVPIGARFVATPRVGLRTSEVRSRLPHRLQRRRPQAGATERPTRSGRGAAREPAVPDAGAGSRHRPARPSGAPACSGSEAGRSTSPVTHPGPGRERARGRGPVQQRSKRVSVESTNRLSRRPEPPDRLPDRVIINVEVPDDRRDCEATITKTTTPGTTTTRRPR